MSGTAWGMKGKGNRALELPAGDAVDVAPAGRLRLRYNSQSGDLERSVDGGAYSGFSGSAGGWNDDGTTVRLSTPTDNVVIGAVSPLGSEKLYVVGDVTIGGGGDVTWAYTAGQKNMYVQDAPADAAGAPLSIGGGGGGIASASGGGQGGYANLGAGWGGAGTAALAAGGGGSVGITGGRGGTDNGGGGGAGGAVLLSGGNGTGDEDGGTAELVGGNGSGTGDGGNCAVDAGTVTGSGQEGLVLIGVAGGRQVSVGSDAHRVRLAVDVPGNESSAMIINGGGEPYIGIDTTTGSEALNLTGGPDGTVNVGTTDTTNVNIGSSGGNIGFFSHAAGPQPTVTGAKAANAALTDLLAKLAGLGLIIDNTT